MKKKAKKKYVDVVIGKDSTECRVVVDGKDITSSLKALAEASEGFRQAREDEMSATTSIEWTSTVELTRSVLALAFETWDTRYRANPEQFMTSVEHLLGHTPESYGEACAVYFEELLKEQADANAEKAR